MKERLIEAGSVIILWLMEQWEDILDTIKTVVVTFIVFFIATTFLFRPVRVEGTSMYPTIKNGSLGFSSIVSRHLSGINRFDIVVIRFDDKLLIKRVIGLPGDTIRYESGQLYVNGEHIEEDFLDKEHMESEMRKYSRSIFTADLSVTLGEDEYFCMGDNRIVSADSRVYGPFSSKDIISSGILVFFPFDHLGIAD